MLIIFISIRVWVRTEGVVRVRLEHCGRGFLLSNIGAGHSWDQVMSGVGLAQVDVVSTFRSGSDMTWWTGLY